MHFIVKIIKQWRLQTLKHPGIIPDNAVEVTLLPSAPQPNTLFRRRTHEWYVIRFYHTLCFSFFHFRLFHHDSKQQFFLQSLCGYLTFINKHQSKLVFGAAVPQLSRVGALVLPGELIKQYLHQTFGPVEVDPTVLRGRRKKKMFFASEYASALVDVDEVWRRATQSGCTEVWVWANVKQGHSLTRCSWYTVLKKEPRNTEVTDEFMFHF